MNRRSVTWAAAAIVALAFVAWRAYDQFGPQPVNGHLPADFPNAYLAPADNGKVDAVVVWRGRVPPPSIDEGGVVRWPVWACRNPHCPGARDGQPYLFAYGDAPDASPPPSIACPACTAAFAAAKTDKARFDPLQLEMWFTPEATDILATVVNHLPR